MKHIISILLLQTLLIPYASAASKSSESFKAESQASNSPKVSATVIFANALLLAEIYRKIEKIADKGDRDQLTPLLAQLNSGLDQVLAFKNSFTPVKRQRIERQLSSLQSQIQSLALVQSKELKTSSLQLAASLLDLVDVILDRAKAESQPTTF